MGQQIAVGRDNFDDRLFAYLFLLQNNAQDEKKNSFKILNFVCWKGGGGYCRKVDFTRLFIVAA